MTVTFKLHRSRSDYANLPILATIACLLACFVMPQAVLSQSWQTQVTVCNLDGSSVSGRGEYGFYDGSMVSGVLTGSGGGSGTPGYFTYSPGPNDWLQQSGSYLYSWMDDGPPCVYAEAFSHLYNPNSDTPVYATGSGHADVNFSLYKFYLWQTWWDDLDTGLPPNLASMPIPPASLHFLLRTDLRATSVDGYGTNGYNPVSAADYRGLSAISSVQDMFGESVSAIAPVAPDPLSGGYDYQKAEQTGGGRHLVTVPLQWINGKAIYTVTLTGQGHAQAVNTIGNIGLFGTALASGILNGYAQQDDRTVTISSPSLEANCYFGPLNPTTHTYPQYVRAADGSMHADSVVLPTIYGHWKNAAGNGNSFTANTPGLTNPYYLWSKSGAGTVDSQTAASLGVNQQFLSTVPMNLDFGTEPSTTSDPNTVVAKNPFPLTTTVRVDVTDGPNTDKATAANIYTVTYHLPFENPAKSGTEVKDDTPLQVVSPLSVNTLTIIQIPREVESVDLAGGSHIAGGLATAVSAGLPLIKVVATVSEPELVIAQTVFALFGYTLGLAPDAKPETEPIPVATDYAEFKADVTHQVAINLQPVGQKDKIRFDPPQLAETVAAQFQANNADWQKDKYFWPDPLMAHLSISSQAFRYAKKQQVVGDAYGIKGYLGPRFHSVRAEGGFYTVTHWTYTAGPTP